MEIVHKPKPTSLTLRSVFLYVRKRMQYNNRTLPGHASDGAVTSALARFLVGIFRQVVPADLPRISAGTIYNCDQSGVALRYIIIRGKAKV